MPATPQLLAAILAVQTAIQGIAVGNGCFVDVPAGNVVLDPTDLASVQSAPFCIVGGNLDALRVTKDLVDLSGTRLQDTLTLPTVTRLDAGGTDFAHKLTAWVQWVADLERVLAVASFGPGEVLNGLTVVAWPQTVHPPMMGTPESTIVVAQVDIQVHLKQRTNGQP